MKVLIAEDDALSRRVLEDTITRSGYDLVVTTDASVFEGDMLCANLVYTGTHKGEYLGIAPTGKRVVVGAS